MKLEFDSISELEQFLMFSAHIGKAFAPAPVQHVDPGADFYQAPREDTPEDTGAINQDAKNAEFVAATSKDNAEIADKPKRTRRTKAEMEAIRAGEVPNAPAGGQTETSVAPSVSESPSNSAAATGSPAGANPFAVAPAAAVLDAPEQNATTLAAIATQPAPERKPIESIEHLRACQSFIQAHGMTKYNESFRDGLNANIAAYTPEQRSQHVAILEQLAA